MKKLVFIFLFHTISAGFIDLQFAATKTVEEEAGRISTQAVENKKVEEKKPERPESPKLAQKEKKDPRLACLLSLVIPGSGHLYLRKDLKGAGFCLASATGYGIAGYTFYRYYLSGSGSKTTGIVVSGLFFFAAGVVHAVSVVEAYADAEEMNLRKEQNRSSMIQHQDIEIVIEK